MSKEKLNNKGLSTADRKKAFEIFKTNVRKKWRC